MQCPGEKHFDFQPQVADYTMVPETARMANIPRVCLQVVSKSTPKVVQNIAKTFSFSKILWFRFTQEDFSNNGIFTFETIVNRKSIKL